jgi:hypothetical protein
VNQQLVIKALEKSLSASGIFSWLVTAELGSTFDEGKLQLLVLLDLRFRNKLTIAIGAVYHGLVG